MQNLRKRENHSTELGESTENSKEGTQCQGQPRTSAESSHHRCWTPQIEKIAEEIFIISKTTPKLDPTIPDLSIPDLKMRMEQEKSKELIECAYVILAFLLLAIFVQYHSHATHTYTSEKARTRGSLYNSCGCSGCIKPNCGQCRMCLDMPKFGGPGKRKKKCQQRVCVTKKNSVLITEGDFNTLLIPSAWLNDKVNVKSLDYLKNKQLVSLYHQFSC